MSRRRQDWPRFARAEIRSFADELDRGGWTYEGEDASGHTIWRHPAASAHFKLPSMPSHFSVRGARREVLRLLGRKPVGKRKGKAKVAKPRRDFAFEQAQKKATEARKPPPKMRSPVRCKWCHHVHDAATVKVVETQYVDCTCWRCPGCGVLIDNRPERWGGSAIPVKPEPPKPMSRTPKYLPWENRADDYDRGLDRLMRERPHR